MKELSEEQKFRIQRNMQDAGFRTPVIAQFLDLEKKHCRGEQYRLLSCQKTVLLQKLHRIQYKIDCLDHLIFVMQQEDEQERKNNSSIKEKM